MDIKATLDQFICTELLDEGGGLDYDENLLSDGMVDSLGMLRLVGYIESSYGISVPPEHFVIENFRTINVLGDYLQQRMQSP